MHEDRLGRRQVLRRAGLITGGVAATSVGLASPALASGGQDDDRLEGSYMITRTEDAGPGSPITSVFSLAGGGVLINQDIDPTGTHSTGSWAAATGGRFTSTFWTGFPGDESAGTPALTARVRARGRVQRGAISGTYDVSFFVVPTGEEVFVVTGTYAGPRIVA